MIGRVAIPSAREHHLPHRGTRVEIWFVPSRRTGGNAEQFRIAELTGMRFTSLSGRGFHVAHRLAVSLILEFFWRLAPIPRSYPTPR